MDGSQKEIQDEIAVLEARRRNLEDFGNRASGSLVGSDDAEQIKQRLFEVAYCNAAQARVNGQLTRLGRFAEDGSSQEEMIAYQTEYVAILKDGDWSPIKKRLGLDLTGLGLTFEEADQLGLPHDFTFEGVAIFGTIPALGENVEQPDVEARSDAWERLVKSKLDMVPDQSEPYKYPDMQVLLNLTPSR